MVHDNAQQLIQEKLQTAAALLSVLLTSVVLLLCCWTELRLDWCLVDGFGISRLAIGLVLPGKFATCPAPLQSAPTGR